MIRPIAFALAFVPLGAYATPKWKPHKITVIPGKPLAPQDIKPYVPPKLPPEPEPEPSDVKVVLVLTDDAAVNMRPWSSPLVGNLQKGARLPVKGVAKTTKGGCSSKIWYALEPFGWLCGRDANPTDQPATTESVLKVREGSRLPFQYVMVLIPEGESIPMWGSLDDLKHGREPERKLERGDTIAIEKPFVWDGTKYWISVEGKVMPQKRTSLMGPGASWHGLDLDEKITLPFGWVTPEKANVYAAPPEKAGKGVKADAQLARRTRVNIVGEQLVGKKRWLKVTIAEPPPPETFGEIMANRAPPKQKDGEEPPTAEDAAAALPELWISADVVNEVRILEPPKTITPGVTRWIDVDLGEQVLVAYEGDRPVFATLVSSGRAIPTPMGTYPVWAKAAAITMKSQPYDEKAYFVNKVPWSTFFQWHNAIHGAYWHDRFGMTKSHGCVNVSPLDAKKIFEWVTPPLPPGWTGLRPLDLLQSPHVVVRNSRMKKQFRQDRPIGPPDRALEAERAVEAEAKRAEAAAQAAAAADPNAEPAQPAPAPTPDATPPAPQP